MRDVIAALRAFLLDQDEVVRVVGNRIHGGRLPQSNQDSPPEGAILLRLAGGTPIGGYVELQRPRVDVIFYHTSPTQADAIRRIVHPLLRAIRPFVQSGTKIHAVEEEGGPIAGVESDTNWPYVFTSWRVLASEK